MVILGVVVVALWCVELIDLTQHRDLVSYGIVPRDPAHLTGILVAPFVHLSAGHLAGNTIPLAVFGWVALTGNGARFAVTTVIVVLVSGLGVWLTGPTGTVTVGSSGVVFGWCGYLLVRGAIDWRHRIGGLSLVVVLGSMVWGLLPVRSGVSWQGHIFGFAGGALAAVALTRRAPVVVPPVGADAPYAEDR
ncbi:MAG: rhomboid family intramembrane serine protease [Actinobacteria bacterium]|nr:rhomboid family intramembrane serine protease [Actinomycetota bacterium]